MGDDMLGVPEAPDVHYVKEDEWDGSPALGEDHDDIAVCCRKGFLGREP